MTAMGAIPRSGLVHFTAFDADLRSVSIPLFLSLVGRRSDVIDSSMPLDVLPKVEQQTVLLRFVKPKPSTNALAVQPWRCSRTKHDNGIDGRMIEPFGKHAYVDEKANLPASKLCDLRFTVPCG